MEARQDEDNGNVLVFGKDGRRDVVAPVGFFLQARFVGAIVVVFAVVVVAIALEDNVSLWSRPERWDGREDIFGFDEDRCRR